MYLSPDDFLANAGGVHHAKYAGIIEAEGDHIAYLVIGITVCHINQPMITSLSSSGVSASRITSCLPTLSRARVLGPLSSK